ncbi:hypothetical protein BG74_00195 [Sodalis-like endosymbiont of Proechinophthirus fluctus]|nr:hypothetical protein BG74_00195 [Sodalis-like endosymbiont of Proechinophthirus fluctus]
MPYQRKDATRKVALVSILNSLSTNYFFAGFSLSTTTANSEFVHYPKSAGSRFWETARYRTVSSMII